MYNMNDERERSRGNRKKCFVIGCENTQDKNSMLRFHNFPKKQTRFVERTNIFGNIEKIDVHDLWCQNLGLKKATEVGSAMVCSLHFTEDDYAPAIQGLKRKYLKKNAVPTQHILNTCTTYTQDDAFEKPQRITRTSTSRNEMSEESSEANNEANDSSTNSNNTIEIKSKKTRKRRRSKTKFLPEQSEILAFVNELKELNNSLIKSTPNSRESEDECDIFAKHVTMQLKQIPSNYRIDAMDEIQATLSKYRKKASSTSPIEYIPSD